MRDMLCKLYTYVLFIYSPIKGPLGAYTLKKNNIMIKTSNE